jgi:hypothetical protein
VYPARSRPTLLDGVRPPNTPNTRSAYRVAWRSFLAFCSARQLELESVKALSRRGVVGSASGKQLDAEATLGGRPGALRFPDDARGS